MIIDTTPEIKMTIYEKLNIVTFCIAYICKYVGFSAFMVLGILKTVGFCQSVNLLYILIAILVSYSVQYDLFDRIYIAINQYLESFNLKNKNDDRK